MNKESSLKRLQKFAHSKNSAGFTLIELLVVVIIIGVLSAIALPSLLAQVGKAREAEAKTNLGNINHSQQTYFSENAAFATNLDDLQVTLPTLKFYNIPSLGSTAADAGATWINGKDNAINGTRDYISVVAYDTTAKSFTTKIARGKVKAADYELALTDVTGKGVGPGIEAEINSATADEIK